MTMLELNGARRGRHERASDEAHVQQTGLETRHEDLGVSRNCLMEEQETPAARKNFRPADARVST
jgi:hypothetical protein